VFGQRHVSEQVNNNSSETQYPGCEHGNAKGKVNHHTLPQRLLPRRYSVVKTLLTIMAVAIENPRAADPGGKSISIDQCLDFSLCSAKDNYPEV
jgi:hypothetical protein